MTVELGEWITFVLTFGFCGQYAWALGLNWWTWVRMFYCVLVGCGMESSWSKLSLFSFCHWDEILRPTSVNNCTMSLSDILKCSTKVAHIFISGIQVIFIDHRKLSCEGQFYYCASGFVPQRLNWFCKDRPAVLVTYSVNIHWTTLGQKLR